MFYLNTIEQLFLFVEQLDQLEVCLPYSRLLTGIPILAVFQNLRWNSNKTSLFILRITELHFIHLLKLLEPICKIVWNGTDLEKIFSMHLISHLWLVSWLIALVHKLCDQNSDLRFALPMIFTQKQEAFHYNKHSTLQYLWYKSIVQPSSVLPTLGCWVKFNEVNLWINEQI